MSFIARATRRGAARGAVGAGLKSGVAQPALAATRDQQTLAVAHHIADQLGGVRVRNEGAERRFDDQIRTVFAKPIFARAALPVARPVQPRIAKIRQRVEAAVGAQINATAVAAVAAVRAALGPELFPQKTQAAIAPLDGTDPKGCFVNEFQGRL